MAQRVLIDGNNLLHALWEHAPVPNVGRETMLRLIERWAAARDMGVVLVFDGPRPRGDLLRPHKAGMVEVRFSAPKTADDVLAELIRGAESAAGVRVISSDGAIRYEAGLRRCAWTDSTSFVHEIFSKEAPRRGPSQTVGEKPAAPTAEELNPFGPDIDGNDDEPFDGYEAMRF